MRLVVALMATVLGWMMLPASVTPTALAQESVEPGETAAPSGSQLPDPVVELLVEPEARPVLEWDITVTGGSPSSDHLTLEAIADPPVFYGGSFSVAVDGESASVEMAPVLSPRKELTNVGCLDDLEPPTEIEPIVTTRSFVLEVVSGRRYSCFPFIFDLDETAPTVPPEDNPTVSPPEPTVPTTDTSAGAPPVTSSGSWPMALSLLAGVLGASLMFAVRPRRRRSIDPS